MFLNRRQLEEELRELLAGGASPADALRTLYQRGYGKLFLAEALSAVNCIPLKEAQRNVIKAFTDRTESK